MTEKRFWYDFEDCTGAKMVDFKEDKEYPLETIGDFRKLEDLMNKQDERIKELEKENLQYQKELYYFNKTYERQERGLNIVPAMCTINSPTPSRKELFEKKKHMKKKIFDLIDEKIEKYEEAVEWGRGMDADYSAIGYSIIILRGLRKELENELETI